jgi:hypothetical protein
MGDLWNLDIDDYNLNELQILFKLKEPFTLEDIINADMKFREHIQVDSTVDDIKKKDITDFLNKAKNLLIQNKKNEMKKYQSEIYNNTTPIIKNNFQKPISSQLAQQQQYTADGKKHTIFDKTISINSQFRDNYYKTKSTKFSISLPTKLKNVTTMKITHFEMPEAYYQFSKALGNNFFWFGWDKGGAGLNWHYVNIPDGTYDRTELQNIINVNIEIATSLDPASPVCKIDITSQKTIFSVGDPADKLKLKFNQTRHGNNTTVASSIPEADWKDIFSTTNLAENCGWVLGFRAAEYINGNTYVSEGLFDYWGPKCIYVIVDDFNKNFSNSIEPTYHFSLGNDNILARISLPPITSEFKSGISLAERDSHKMTRRTYQGPVDIEKMNISVVDEHGRILDLNNMDISLAINCTCLFN